MTYSEWLQPAVLQYLEVMREIRGIQVTIGNCLHPHFYIPFCNFQGTSILSHLNFRSLGDGLCYCCTMKLLEYRSGACSQNSNHARSPVKSWFQLYLLPLQVQLNTGCLSFEFTFTLNQASIWGMNLTVL